MMVQPGLLRTDPKFLVVASSEPGMILTGTGMVHRHGAPPPPFAKLKAQRSGRRHDAGRDAHSSPSLRVVPPPSSRQPSHLFSLSHPPPSSGSPSLASHRSMPTLPSRTTPPVSAASPVSASRVAALALEPQLAMHVPPDVHAARQAVYAAELAWRESSLRTRAC